MSKNTNGTVLRAIERCHDKNNLGIPKFWVLENNFYSIRIDKKKYFSQAVYWTWRYFEKSVLDAEISLHIFKYFESINDYTQKVVSTNNLCHEVAIIGLKALIYRVIETFTTRGWT